MGIELAHIHTHTHAEGGARMKTHFAVQACTKVKDSTVVEELRKVEEE